jgi:hypothetical protein
VYEGRKETIVEPQYGTPLILEMKKSEEKNFFDKIKYVSFTAEGVSENT